MKSRSVLFMLFVIVMLVLTACGGAAATPAPPAENSAGQPAAPSSSSLKTADGALNQPSAEVAALPALTNAAYEITNRSGDLTVLERSNRMIVKNADIHLLVEDTNNAIDRATQIVGDAGGYVVSSRVWYQSYQDHQLKYATVTLGVPVDEFEHVLSRLRGLAIKVEDETASGDDVTDQYVDLQSQLTNLEATRDRVKSFLEDAKTVDEALRINQQLSDIEGQIEQIKGRMNYLNDRSAFSTITISFDPQLPKLEPTPAPKAWSPAETFKAAKKVLAVAYQGIAEFMIWFVVVVIPIFLPPALILWALWKLFTRRVKKATVANS